MTIFSLHRTALLFALAAAGLSAHAPPSSAQQAPESTTSTARRSCPADDFRHFAQQFADDQDVQKRFTQFPLTKQYLDLDAEPEPQKVTHALTRGQVKLPLLPLKREREAKALGIQFVHMGKARARIDLRKADSDYQVSYYFLKNDCWQLVRIEDHSL